MSRSLTDLCPIVRPAAEAVILWSVEARHFLIVVDTLRTHAEQQRYLDDRTSWTPRSKHLAQLRCRLCGSLFNSAGLAGLSHAIDLAPLGEYYVHGRNKVAWNPNDPIWRELGERGELYGLRWGGRWATPDLGHLEAPSGYLGAEPR